MLEARRKTTAIMSMLLGSIAVISLVVGGIGIMNIMLCLCNGTDQGDRDKDGGRSQVARYPFSVPN